MTFLNVLIFEKALFFLHLRSVFKFMPDSTNLPIRRRITIVLIFLKDIAVFLFFFLDLNYSISKNLIQFQIRERCRFSDNEMNARKLISPPVTEIFAISGRNLTENYYSFERTRIEWHLLDITYLYFACIEFDPFFRRGRPAYKFQSHYSIVERIGRLLTRKATDFTTN